LIPKGERPMKKHLITLVLISVLIIGLSIMLYPIVSDYINSLTQSRIVARYYQDLSSLDDGSYLEMLEDARGYNERLLGKRNRYVMSEEDMREYRALLDFSGTGVIGILEIVAIKVNLPIYHGSGNSVLQVGAGHFEGSSLPVGGTGTHSVIAGHSGLPSSTLLTNLDRLGIGDTFTVKTLKDTLYYEIDRIETVEPEDLSLLEIDKGMDYCTLLTCTPYGINSHRLLVRGRRVFPETVKGIVQSNTQSVDSAVWITVTVLTVSMYIIFVILTRASRKQLGKRVLVYE